jgi:hypothetical protein
MNWVIVYQKTPFFIVTAVKTSNITYVDLKVGLHDRRKGTTTISFHTLLPSARKSGKAFRMEMIAKALGCWTRKTTGCAVQSVVETIVSIASGQ